MAERLSRRKISRYVATQATGGKAISSLLEEVAAYLVDTGRTREYELIVRDIEDALAQQGVVVADITTANDEAISQASLQSLVPKAKQLAIRHHQDKTLLGGALIELPGLQLDASVRGRLAKLRSLEG